MFGSYLPIASLTTLLEIGRELGGKAARRRSRCVACVPDKRVLPWLERSWGCTGFAAMQNKFSGKHDVAYSGIDVRLPRDLRAFMELISPRIVMMELTSVSCDNVVTPLRLR